MGDVAFRPARLEDAAALAELINMAGEGLPLQLWDTMRGAGETAWDVGRRRAGRDAGSFSWRNATLAEVDGEVAGALIGYAQPETPEPIDDAMPPVFVPLQELENLAPNTWYVNVLAVFSGFRRRGIGARLLTIADEIAARQGKPGLSVIVSDSNPDARRLHRLRLPGDRQPREGQRRVAYRGRALDPAHQGALTSPIPHAVGTNAAPALDSGGGSGPMNARLARKSLRLAHDEDQR